MEIRPMRVADLEAIASLSPRAWAPAFRVPLLGEHPFLLLHDDDG